jgi:hypothetical protein
MDALQQATGRTFTDVEQDEIRTHQRRAYRWTFLASGLEHPNFVRIVEQLTKHSMCEDLLGSCADNHLVCQWSVAEQGGP